MRCVSSLCDVMCCVGRHSSSFCYCSLCGSQVCAPAGLCGLCGCLGCSCDCQHCFFTVGATVHDADASRMWYMSSEVTCGPALLMSRTCCVYVTMSCCGTSTFCRAVVRRCIGVQFCNCSADSSLWQYCALLHYKHRLWFCGLWQSPSSLFLSCGYLSSFWCCCSCNTPLIVPLTGPSWGSQLYP